VTAVFRSEVTGRSQAATGCRPQDGGVNMNTKLESAWKKSWPILNYYMKHTHQYWPSEANLLPPTSGQ
jgi:hypothetical protein